MWAITTLEEEKKKLLRILNYLGDPATEEERYREATIRNIRMTQGQLKDVELGLKALYLMNFPEISGE